MATESATEYPDPPEETYEEMMKATLHAICKHGYSELSMYKIADEFEKSRTLLQHYYGTKQALLVEFLDYTIEGYMDTTDLEIENPSARLNAFIDRSLFGEENKEFDFWEYQTALFELRLAARENETYRQHINRHYQFVTTTIADMIEEGVEEGIFQDVDPKHTAILLQDIMDSARRRKIMLGHEDAPQIARQTIEEQILSNICLEN